MSRCGCRHEQVPGKRAGAALRRSTHRTNHVLIREALLHERGAEAAFFELSNHDLGGETVLHGRALRSVEREVDDEEDAAFAERFAQATCVLRAGRKVVPGVHDEDGVDRARFEAGTVGWNLPRFDHREPFGCRASAQVLDHGGLVVEGEDATARADRGGEEGLEIARAGAEICDRFAGREIEVSDDLDGALPARTTRRVEHRLEARDVGEVVLHALAVVVTVASVVIVVPLRSFAARGRVGLGRCRGPGLGARSRGRARGYARDEGEQHEVTHGAAIAPVGATREHEP